MMSQLVAVVAALWSAAAAAAVAAKTLTRASLVMSKQQVNDSPPELT